MVVDNKPILNNINNISKDYSLINEEYYYLTEEDFYPPSDNRIWKSGIDDIEGGDNFVDFCEEYFELLEKEGYYD